MWMWKELQDQFGKLWPKKGPPQSKSPQMRDPTSSPEFQTSSDEVTSRRRMACYCCTKRFSRLEQFGHFFGLGQKCPICENMVCKECILDHRCHACIVRGKVSLEPDDLLRLEVRELITLLKTMHCEDPSFVTWPKPYLVKQMLVVLEANQTWDPSDHLPRTEGEFATGQRDQLSETERRTPGGRFSNPDESTGATGKSQGPPPSMRCPNVREGNECVDCTEQVLRMRERKALENFQEERLDIPNEELCKICMESRADTILLDCGHMVCCTYCSELIRQCPICRLPISFKVRASNLE